MGYPYLRSNVVVGTPESQLLAIWGQSARHAKLLWVPGNRGRFSIPSVPLEAKQLESTAKSDAMIASIPVEAIRDAFPTNV